MQYKKYDYIINGTSCSNNKLKEMLKLTKIIVIGRLIEISKYSFLPGILEDVIIITDFMDDIESMEMAAVLYDAKRYANLTHMIFKYKFKAEQEGKKQK